MQKEISIIIDELQDRIMEEIFQGIFQGRDSEYLDLCRTLKIIAEDPALTQYTEARSQEQRMNDCNTELDIFSDIVEGMKLKNKNWDDRRELEDGIKYIGDIVRRGIRQVYADEIYKGQKSIEEISGKLQLIYKQYVVQMYAFLNDMWLDRWMVYCDYRRGRETVHSVYMRLLGNKTEIQKRIYGELQTMNQLRDDLLIKWDEGILLEEQYRESALCGEYMEFYYKQIRTSYEHIERYRKLLLELSTDKTEEEILYNCFLLAGKMVGEVEIVEGWQELIEYAMLNKMPLEELRNPDIVYYGKECARNIEEVQEKPYEFAEIIPINEDKVNHEKAKERYTEDGERQATTIREGIGFDHCKFNCEINRIDMEKLLSAIKEKKKTKKQKRKEWIDMYYGSSSTRRYILTDIEGADIPLIREQKWSSLIIQLSPYEIFSVKRNNAKVGGYGASNKNYSQLEIKVRPTDIWLGNWNNYTLKEIQRTVQLALRRLEDFGLYIQADSVKFQSAEINNTFAFSAEFNILFRYLRYYQTYFPNRSYTHGVFLIQNGKEKTDTNIRIGEEAEAKAEGMTITGFKSFSDKTEVKAYEKRRETQSKHNVVVDPVNGGLSVRLEFSFNEPRSIRNYFRNLYCKEDAEYKNKEHFGLFDEIMTEDALKKIYRVCVGKFFIQPFERYCRESTAMLEEIVEKQNYSKKSWKLEAQRDLFQAEIKDINAPLIFAENDMDAVIRRTSKLHEKSSKYIRQYKEIAKGVLGGENGYCLVSQFIRAALEEEGISNAREITYIRKPALLMEEEEEDME